MLPVITDTIWRDYMRRKALIDGDLLVHEVAVLGQYYEEADVEKEHLLFRHFNYLEEVLTTRIEEICEAAGCDNEPIIYLTGKNNFRYDVATVKPYKGNRTKEKPVHFNNVKWYLISRYNAIIVDGMEADDALATAQMSDYWNLYGSKDNTEQHSRVCKTVICTRDKDLRQVPGFHYGWEVGNQPEYKLRFVDEIGTLEPTWKEGVSAKTGKPTKSLKKLTGTGLKWFYTQTLTGDTTDNIPGLPGCGNGRALELLEECTTEAEMFKAVLDEYMSKYGEEFEERLLEQARLVWMVRELNEDGSPCMWEIPE